MFADPERRARALTYRRNLYARLPELRQREKDRAHWNLTGIQYAEKLLANRRRAALQRLSERAARSEERRKDTTDLAWNKIRRQITRAIDTVIQNAREEILNTALTDAWTKYTEALSQGRVLELEEEYEATAGAWVQEQVRRQLPAAVPDDKRKRR